jgi:hypothetical protein
MWRLSHFSTRSSFASLGIDIEVHVDVDSSIVSAGIRTGSLDTGLIREVVGIGASFAAITHWPSSGADVTDLAGGIGAGPVSGY